MKKETIISKSKLTLLQTVYPPISNQEAVWLQADKDVERFFRESDFYMIGGRAEARFQNVTVDQAENTVEFDFVVGDEFSDPVVIRLNELPAISENGLDTFHIEAGDKLIRVWDGPIGNDGSEVLEWFTTEKLIWDRSRNRSGVLGLDKYREAATYDLLYVGIAKIGDSFDRLIKHGHKARMEILSNEPQRYPGARVTDEIYLFLFAAQPLFMTSFDLNHEFTDEDFENGLENKRIVADAEKAFVSLLKPDYNVVKFANYPKGKDGLYDAGFDRYGYAICECLTFDTAHGRVRGGRDPLTGFVTNDADSIFVDGENARLYIAGVDFPDS